MNLIVSMAILMVILIVLIIGQLTILSFGIRKCPACGSIVDMKDNPFFVGKEAFCDARCAYNHYEIMENDRPEGYNEKKKTISR